MRRAIILLSLAVAACSPQAVEKGGAATTGRGPVLDVVPETIHQPTPLIFGCKRDIELIERYHAMHDRGENLVFDAPLFKTRSLFRAG